MSQKPLAICLMGPTASGKTDLAIELTKLIPADIISVDSSLVYRDMNIGSAKPDAKTLAQYPHRLIDIRDPSEPYSVADFRDDAIREIEDVLQAGRTPLLVGGTMLYFKVLREGIAPMPAADQKVRDKIQAEADRVGWKALHQKLTEFDPIAAEKIHPNNPQRLMRALEVYELTGVALGEHWKKHQKEAAEALPCEMVQFAMAPQERSVLHERIALRFKQMLDQGLIDEVKRLRERGDLDKSLPAIRAVGYRQVWEYLEGELGYNEMVEKGIIATRQLAKRQMTWLRSWPDLQWLDAGAPGLAQLLLKKSEITQYISK